MPRFRVIVIGRGMDIPPEGFIGFATTRFVHATSAVDAATKALDMVSEAVALEPAFAASPQPTLAIDQVFRVHSPLKRSFPNSGYTFFSQSSEIEDALDLERKAGSGWFL